MFKNMVIALLEFQTKRFLKKHQPKIVAIAGSVGKTSTKLFTVTVLKQKFRVLTQEGNHNTHVSVPMVIFDLPLPANLQNPFAWVSTLWKTERKIRQTALDHDVIILELGTDAPGDVPRFGRYLHPDIGVVTAVAPEHMEFFKTIEAVAQEELAISNFSQLTLINRDEIDARFADYVQTTNISTYGTSGVAEYHYLIEDFEPGQGFRGKFVSPEFGEQPATLQLVGEHNIKAAVAAGAIGAKLGLNAAHIVAGLTQIQPVPGRMRLLKGLLDSTLIDDTYNSSPIAATAALQTLYLFPATQQKIAILGSMAELGDYSAKAHQEVGEMCDPTLLDWIVTIGDEAERYLAPAAAGRGCQVRSFKSPYDAGAFVHSVLQPHAVVLAKGSQNGVFTEEALKVLLHSTVEEEELVRQSPDWLAIKRDQFAKIVEPNTRKDNHKS